MAKITLQPLDDGQKSVEIPIGKTTIGRGLLLGCGDKKVSRNHAVLEVTDEGEVYLTPTHVNPCFYQPTADSPGLILKKDKPHKLANGDSFSLLPRAFRYQLIVTNDVIDSKNEENLELKTEEKTNGSTDEKHEEEINENSADAESAVPEKEVIKEETTNSTTILDEEKPKETTEPVSELPIGEEENKPDSVDSHEEPKTELNGNSVPEIVAEAEPSVTEDSVEEKPKETKEESRPRIRRTLPEWILDLVAPPQEGKKILKTTKPKQKNRQEKESPVKRKPAAEVQVKKKVVKKQVERRNESEDEMQAEHSQNSSQKRVTGRSSRTNRQTRQGISLEDFIASDDDEWQSDKSEPRHKRRRGSRKEDDSGSDWETEHKKTKRGTHKYGSGSESGSDWGTSSQKKRKTPKAKRRSKRVIVTEISDDDVDEIVDEVVEDVEDVEDIEDVDDRSQSAKKHKRIPCTYGKKCFRKNSNHLDQFSHPGDSDYNSDSEPNKKNDVGSESESDAATVSKKKECPYGANCFRKNPQHKKDFKHTKKVRPQREAAKQAGKKTKGSKDSEEPDSYDLNDSFLNDESDEYNPVDSGSDYESSQEVRRHSKVTRGATKNKKTKRV